MQTLCPESSLWTAPNWPKIPKMTMTSQFADMTSTSNFFDIFLFLLSSLVTGPSFMSISSLVLELWQFSFIRDWPEIRKSVWVLSNIGRLGRVMDTKLGTNVIDRMLLNTAKYFNNFQRNFSKWEIAISRSSLTVSVRIFSYYFFQG